MFVFKKNRKNLLTAFTFTELMVVVLIISLVTTVAIASVSVVRRSARDKKVMSNISELRLALESYKMVEGEYPDNQNFNSGEQLVSPSGVVFYDKIPDNVFYSLINANYYEMEFILEGSLDGLFAGLNWATPDKIISNDIKLDNDYSLYFDGSNDYLEVLDDDSLDISNQITMAAWIKPSSLPVGSAGRIIIKPIATWSEPYYMYTLFVGTSGLGFGISDGITRKWAWKGSIIDNTWQHVAATYDGELMKWYINGEEVGSQSENMIIGNNNLNLNIGRALGVSTFFNGLIDEVFLYNRSLSIEEINLIKDGFKISNIGLVSYWGMNDGSGCVIYDSFANGNDGVFKPYCSGDGPIWTLN